MEPLSSIAMIWCDVNFECKDSYNSIIKEIHASIKATPGRNFDEIAAFIIDEDREQLFSKAFQLFTVATIDKAVRKVEENLDKKIIVICSGSVGRYLVPHILSRYPHVHNFYILPHNIGLHMDWADEYQQFVKFFDHPTDLLLRLLRDIASYFIERGEMFLEVNAPEPALKCFICARNMEIYANHRDKKELNIEYPGQNKPAIEFREHLNLLDGENGLIARAESKIRELVNAHEN